MATILETLLNRNNIVIYAFDENDGTNQDQIDKALEQAEILHPYMSYNCLENWEDIKDLEITYVLLIQVMMAMMALELKRLKIITVTAP